MYCIKGMYCCKDFRFQSGLHLWVPILNSYLLARALTINAFRIKDKILRFISLVEARKKCFLLLFYELLQIYLSVD